MSAVAWVILVLALSLTTFGIGGSFILLMCSSSLIIGILFILLYRGKAEYFIFVASVRDSKLGLPSSCLTHVEEKVRNPDKLSKEDRRMTGSIMIDEPLHEILQYALRDFVRNWFSTISEDEQFIQEMNKVAKEVVINFSNRCKEVNWVLYLTTKLVDDFASHLRLFRLTQHKIKRLRNEMDGNVKPDMTNTFFTLELDMEDDMSRDGICTTLENEKAYLRDVSEILLYLLISSQNFENKLFRFIIREVFVNYLILPAFESFSDPDYINQLIVWLCKDIVITSDVFLTVIKSTDNIDELTALQESINHEIAVERSKDTGGEDDTEIKQRLSSLFYVKKVIEMKIQRLNDGVEETDSLGLPSQIDYTKWLSSGQKLPDLSLDFVLKNNIALSYFIEYMTSINKEAYLFFYLNVEGFKVSAEQQLSAAHLNDLSKNNDITAVDLEDLRQAAMIIYQTNLSEEATPRIIIYDCHNNDITSVISKKLLMRITTDPLPSESWFDEVHTKVYEMLLETKTFFSSFKRSPSYVKLLAELDLLRDTSKSDDEDAMDSCNSGDLLEPLFNLADDTLSVSSFDQEDTVSFGDAMSDGSGGSSNILNSDSILPVSPSARISAGILSTGKVTGNGRSYTVYKVHVTKLDEAYDSLEEWDVYRRYSDFHDIHTVLSNKFESVAKLQFPAKKAFNNMNAAFLKKRMHLLNDYLRWVQSLCATSTNQSLKDLFHHFLLQGTYEKEKGTVAKRVEDIVKPLKTVQKVVMSVPDNLIDSVVGAKAGIVRALSSNSRVKHANYLNEASSKVGAALLDPESSTDNIPVRIMLLLMDEVFDLKSKDLWLRRRIVTLLRQIIKATYGDMINRKIVDYVQWMLSPEQLSEYIKSFKDSYWPNGILAPPYPERDKNTRMRTRVAAKMALMCVLSDELKHIIGSETFRKGIMCVFEMFQNSILNKRLIYVLLEGVLETMFTANNFNENFRRHHQHFQKVKKEVTKSQKSAWPASAS